ncbi:hypothetical protein BGX33_009314 [Mortierella sp. NVP41]|nr:hypothetical protein BGX33_009314 [Mortierella sp. NVP41]
MSTTPTQPARKQINLPPEILPLVGWHLAPQDLLQCVQVCREWNDHFIPVLWSIIDSDSPAWRKILQDYDSEQTQGQKDEQWIQTLFNKYGHHIRHLKVHHRDIFRFASRSGTCTRLQSLQVFHLDGNDTLKEKEDQHNNIYSDGQGPSSLDECEEMGFNSVILSPLFEGIFEATDARCRSLTSQKRDWFSIQHFWLLILTNPGLRFLQLHRNLWGLAKMDNAAFYYKTLSGLKHLVELDDPLYRRGLHPLMESVPLVKTFRLEYIDRESPLLAASYPQITSLTLKPPVTFEIRYLFQFVKHFPNLAFLHINHLYINDEEGDGALFGVEDARAILGDSLLPTRLERLEIGYLKNYGDFGELFMELFPLLPKI